MRRIIIGLASAVVLLIGAGSAQADSGGFNDVVPSPYRLTFTVHVDWSSCITYNSGLPPVCDWTASVRRQDPDTTCVDPKAGTLMWASAVQKQSGATDFPVARTMKPAHMTLCLWVASSTIPSYNIALARADVVVPDVPPPGPTEWTPVSAKAAAIDFIGSLSDDTASISASCTGGPTATCATSWMNRTWHWRGQLTFDREKASFVGSIASNACLKRHRRTCWRPTHGAWGEDDETTTQGAS
jgi:hypothetical protein